MTNEERIEELAQSIYLAKNNRYNDVDDGDEKTEFLNQTMDWVNQFTPELELEADWNYLRENGALLGTVASAGVVTYDLPTTVRKLVVSPYRDLTITQDGAVVATFKLVNANQIADPTNPDVADRATVIGRKVIFSRPLKDTEVGGEVHADVINKMPKLTMDDVSLLDLVEPLQLIVLGVAKNATLPDIVQGGISPAVTQKYADLLTKAVGENNQTSEAYDILAEDFSFVQGVW